MAAAWPVTAWVEAQRGRVGFALQIFPIGLQAHRGYLTQAHRG